MSIKRIAATLAAALTFSLAQAAPVLLTPTVNANGDLSAGLSTEQGSLNVTWTTPGTFRHEFLFQYSGLASVNAWMDTSAALDMWATQGITITSAGFMNIAGSTLFIDTFADDTTQFTSAYNLNSFVATGDFILFIEGQAGNSSSTGPGNYSFSYSGGINVSPQAANDVPEPSGFALAGLGLLGALLVSRRRKR